MRRIDSVVGTSKKREIAPSYVEVSLLGCRSDGRYVWRDDTVFTWSFKSQK